MKALVLSRKRSLPVLEEIDFPELQTNQVLVDLKAAALNHRDVLIVDGKYGRIDLPVVLGSDGAGTLNGKDVVINPSTNWGDNPTAQSDNFKILGAPDDGTFAESVAINQQQIHPMPPHLNYQEAAALPSAGLTAYRALFTKGDIQEDDRVLITNIGEGVSVLALQFALEVGARVFVTSSSDEKLEKALELGAEGGANHDVRFWAKDLKSQTGGFDIILDAAAGNSFTDLVNAAAPGGKIIVYGGHNGYTSKLDPKMIFSKQLSILGVTLGTSDEFVSMLRFVNEYEIIPIIDEVYDLEDAAKGFERIQNNEQFGKFVLNI